MGKEQNTGIINRLIRNSPVISRGEFLKIAGAASLSELLASCGVRITVTNDTPTTASRLISQTQVAADVNREKMVDMAPQEIIKATAKLEFRRKNTSRPSDGTGLLTRLPDGRFGCVTDTHVVYTGFFITDLTVASPNIQVNIDQKDFTIYGGKNDGGNNPLCLVAIDGMEDVGKQFPKINRLKFYSGQPYHSESFIAVSYPGDTNGDAFASKLNYIETVNNKMIGENNYPVISRMGGLVGMGSSGAAVFGMGANNKLVLYGFIAGGNDADKIVDVIPAGLFLSKIIDQLPVS
jgi:hypothetical protein